MKKPSWDWDIDESVGYNILGAFEVTLQRFCVLEFTALYLDSKDFDAKWSRKAVENNMVSISKYNELLEEIESLKHQIEMVHLATMTTSDEVVTLSEQIGNIEALDDKIDNIKKRVDSQEVEIEHLDHGYDSLRYDLDKNTAEIEDITNNLADKVLLD